MSESQLLARAWDKELCDALSWRGLLSQRFGWENLNFSVGGSSNQMQFRYAMEFFVSSQYQKLKQNFEKILVLWGITSTARNELWSIQDQSYRNFFLTKNNVFARFLIKHCYDHDIEVQELHRRMLFWNMFFESQNITNFWFDTFNTHNYGCPYKHYITQDHYDRVSGVDWPSYHDFCNHNFSNTKREIEEEIRTMFQVYSLPSIVNLLDHDRCPRDLMSWLMSTTGIKVSRQNQSYHHSDWKIDKEGMDGLIDVGILNPISHHPTKAGHILICNYFLDKLVDHV